MNKLRFILLFAVVLLAGHAAAYDFEKDGLYYNIIDAEAKTVEVTNDGVEQWNSVTVYSGDIVIPSNVTYEGTTYNVTKIASFAFYNSDIESVVIESGVTTIAERAFQYCYNLKSIEFPSTLTSIDYYAFYDNYNLKSVEIPEGVTAIGSWAFGYVGNYIGGVIVILPSTLTSIGESAFWTNNTITTVISHISTPFSISNVFTSGGAILYVPDDTKSLYETTTGWAQFDDIIEGEPKKITVDGLNYTYIDGKDIATVIGRADDELRKITIPGSIAIGDANYTVKTVGAGSFRSCGIDTLIIQDGVELISDNAFGGNSNLHKVTLPTSLKTIGREAFRDCRIDTLAIPEGVDSIGEGAFRYQYDWLRSVSLPSTLRIIGNYAFNYCYNLNSIEIPSGVSIIGDGAFSDCYNLYEVIISEGVKTIGSGAFRNMDNWNWYGRSISIELPSTLTSIGDYAFAYINYLNTVTSRIKTPFEISQSVFCTDENSQWDDEKQQYVQVYTPSSAKLCVPDGTKANYESIAGWNMFSGIYEGDLKDTSVGVLNYSYFDGKGIAIVVAGNYSEIRNLTIPGSITINGSKYIVKEIDANVFQNCRIDTLVIEEGVETIGNNAFRENYDHLRSITLPTTLKTIGNYAFHYCYGINSILIPSGVTIIGEGAFQECHNIRNIIIPDGVEIINKYTFRYCNNLSSVSLPESIVTIGDEAFYGCNQLDTIAIPRKVEYIGSYAFYSTKIKEISIPAATKTIGSDAFSDCRSVTSIRVDAGNTIYDSRNSCNALIMTESNKLLKGCASTIIPNSVVEIGDRAFYGLPTLTGISIPNGVKSIDYAAFADCDALTSVSIPSSVTSIASEAFGWCDALASISIDENNTVYDSRDNCNAIIQTSENRLVQATNNTVIPRGIKKIGNSAFRGVSGIDSLKIPYGVEELEWEALSYTSLHYVELPNSLKKLNDRIFVGSNDLVTIVSKIKNPGISYEGDPFYSDEQWTDQGWVRNLDNATLYVPKGKKEAYQQTSPWYNLSHIIEMDGDVLSTPTLTYDGRYVTATSTDKDVDMYYSVNDEPPTNYYEGPIAVNKLCTVKVFAEKSFAIDSEEAILYVNYLYDGETLKQTVAGHMADAISWFGPDKVEKLTVDGKLNSDEFTAIRQLPNLRFLNLANADIESLEIPDSAFAGSNIVSFVAPAKVGSNVGKGIFANCKQLAAVYWATSDNLPDLSAEAFDNVVNPNLLFYTKADGNAPANVNNVIKGGKATVITLSDATGNNNFYCPVAFTADSITYTHNYQQPTEVGVSQGWETIALPFDVDSIKHETNGKLIPFASYSSSSAYRPFWLYTLQNNNVTKASAIKANVPYLICMPNNDVYSDDFILAGNVTFCAKNAKITESRPIERSQNDVSFVPAYQSVAASDDVFALNVNQEYKGYPAGSLFVSNFREVRPFEAYSVHASQSKAAGARMFTISSLLGGSDDTTGIIDVMMKKNYGTTDADAVIRVYSLSGALVKQGRADEVAKSLPKGIYIANGKKFVVK